MSTAANIATIPGQRPETKADAEKAKPVSWAEFRAKYLVREDGYKYEWLQGAVEKTRRTMDQTQFYILQNLMRFFRNLYLQTDVQGELISEGDMFFQGNHRRPDIAFLTARQIAAAATGENQVPEFIVEIISGNDQINRVHSKMRDYENAGVKVVWHIFPELQIVHVYGGDHLDTMTVCRGDDLCSAAPVLPAFTLAVNAILARPAVQATR